MARTKNTSRNDAILAMYALHKNAKAVADQFGIAPGTVYKKWCDLPPQEKERYQQLSEATESDIVEIAADRFLERRAAEVVEFKNDVLRTRSLALSKIEQILTDLTEPNIASLHWVVEALEKLNAMSQSSSDSDRSASEDDFYNSIKNKSAITTNIQINHYEKNQD